MREKLSNFIAKHRFLITLTIIIAVTLVPTIGISRGYELKTIEIISHIIESIFVIAGVVIAVWQYYISTRSLIQNSERARVDKAIQLSKYYKDHILKLAKPVAYVFENTKIAKILGEISTDSFKDFDKKESDKIFTKEQNAALKSVISDKDFAEVVMSAVRVFSLNNILNSSIIGVDEETHTFKINPEQIANSFMDLIVMEILNDLEYFAMNFTHELADDTAVYSSLHQTYIEIMQLLYHQIAEMNNAVGERYYTNAIELYKRWKEKLDDKEERLYNKIRTPELGTTAKSIKDA